MEQAKNVPQLFHMVRLRAMAEGFILVIQERKNISLVARLLNFGQGWVLEQLLQKLEV